jgi:hypothetical protein
MDSHRARAAGCALALGFLLISGASWAQDDSTASPPPAATPAAAAAPAQPHKHIETEPRKGLIIGGASTWAFGYTFSVVAAVNNGGETARNWNYVPVAGPFLYLHNRTECTASRASADTTVNPCLDDWATPLIFTMFGLVQAVGVTLVAFGFLSPSEHVVTGENAGPAPRDAPNHGAIASWFVTPSVVGQSGLGVAAAGTLF